MALDSSSLTPAKFKDSLSDDLIAHVTEMCGDRGAQWFEDLPEIVAALERNWRVTVRQPFPGIEYNFVADAYSGERGPVVIKIAPPFETTEIHGEAKYLRLHNGIGVVRLLAEDREQKSILIERAVPGAALHERFRANPLGCVGPAINVLKRSIQRPPDNKHDIATLDEWFGRFESRFRGTSFSQPLAEQALKIYRRLRENTAAEFYIHGDFHPGNVVTATREEFLIIDPKGIVGHIGYDIAVFLINLERWLRHRSECSTVLDEAVRRFAGAFDLTELEVRQWVFAHMVISAWWNFEDMPGLYDTEVAIPDIWNL